MLLMMLSSHQHELASAIIERAEVSAVQPDLAPLLGTGPTGLGRLPTDLVTDAEFGLHQCVHWRPLQ